MSLRFLTEQFQRWRAAGEPLVLATVVETLGSTYSKAGRHLLITASGQYAGLVSGGCLEGDLVEHANTVRREGKASLVTYDMRDPADDLWGIGLGCNGMLRLLLQPLNAENDWQPFANLANAFASETVTPASLVISSTENTLAAGYCELRNPADSLLTPKSFDPPRLQSHRVGSAKVVALHWLIKPWPRLLLLGAGPDAAPVATLASVLGWQVTVADHRPGLVTAARQFSVDNVLLVEPDKLDRQLPLNSFDAVVVMSHHLETDTAYLHALLPCKHRYIGILGPTARREKLLADPALAESELARRLRGPVGLDIGADSPQSIALALLAEIHATLHERSGGSLTQLTTDDKP